MNRTFFNFSDVQLIDVDPAKLEETGPYDVLFFRVTENLSTNDKNTVELFSNYIAKNPELRIIDPIEGQMIAVSRITMCEAIQNLCGVEKNMSCAKSISLDLTASGCIQDHMFQNFKFPAICKSPEASTVKGAHIMTIVNNLKSLRQFISENGEKKNLVIQEYINHGGTIFKVYVLGSNYYVDRRVSFPNFPLAGKNEDEIFTFDSQQYKHKLPEQLMIPTTGQWPIPSKEIISNICETAKKHLKLSIFGFDLIQDISTEKFSIIDINYLPDFVGVENFHALLLEHITKK